MTARTSISLRSAVSALLLGLSCVSDARCGDSVEISLQRADAPSETVACMQALVASEDQRDVEGDVEWVGHELLRAARDGKIESAGTPFFLGLAPGQVADVYPLRLDYCMPVSSAPPVEGVTYRTLPQRRVLIGFCASGEKGACQDALLEELKARRAPDGSGTEAQPIIRTGIWIEKRAPTEKEMVERVFQLQKTFETPAEGAPVGITVGGSTPRALGQPPRVEPVGSARAAAMATGFIFAVSEPPTLSKTPNP